jgi:hypothetical protein
MSIGSLKEAWSMKKGHDCATKALIIEAPLFSKATIVRQSWNPDINTMESREAAEARLRENLLETAVEAALQGHDLDAWAQVDERGLEWQAVCKRCGASVAVSERWLYSLLADERPGK